MKEAVNAYRKVSASDEYKELERMKSKSRHNEASALYHAEQVGMNKGRLEGIDIGMNRGLDIGRSEGMNKGIEVGREKERAIWGKKIAEILAEKDAEIARLSNKNTE